MFSKRKPVPLKGEEKLMIYHFHENDINHCSNQWFCIDFFRFKRLSNGNKADETLGRFEISRGDQEIKENLCKTWSKISCWVSCIFLIFLSFTNVYEVSPQAWEKLEMKREGKK